MHLLKFDPAALTLDEISISEHNADPTCHYFWTGCKRVIVPTFTTAGFNEIVWQHPEWVPPEPTKPERRSWITRLLSPWRDFRSDPGVWRPRASGTGTPNPPPREP